jgi:hypothetical protein
MQPLVQDDNAPDTYVSLSGTHNYGLFSSRRFASGEIIVDYNLFGDSYREEDFFSLPSEVVEHGWFLILEGTRCLTSDRFSKFSYVNHSRNPNCVWLRERRLICANSSIPKDTELFIDYRVEPLPSGFNPPDWY